MKKEIIVAIAGGIILGGLISFFVFKTASVMKSINKDQEPVQISQESPISFPSSLSILSPKLEVSLVETENVEIAGLFIPQKLVVISTPSLDKIIKTDENGNFKTNILLENNVNQFTVLAFDFEGKANKKSIVILRNKQTDPDTLVAVGTITDISDANLEITKKGIDESSGSEFIVLPISDQTSFYQSKKNEWTDIKRTDLALGDFIFAEIRKNGTLTTYKIFSSEPLKDLDYSLATGKIKEVNKQKITLSLGDKEVELALGKKGPVITREIEGEIIKTKEEDITPDTDVILIGNFSLPTPQIRHIHILPSPIPQT